MPIGAPSNATTAPTTPSNDQPIGAGAGGLERPRNDRRFPPPGVKDVASYGWTTYKRGVAHGGGARGGASLQQPQRSTLRGRSPRRCGPGCVRESALDAGWHGLRKSYGVKPRAVPASRVRPLARRVVAPHGGEGSGGSDPLFFAAGAAPGRGRWCTPKSTTSPPLFGGRSLHSDPWREGHRALPRSGPINRSVLPLDSRRPGSRPSRPSGYAGARTGPSRHRRPRPGSGPHAPGPPRSPPGDDPTAEENTQRLY